MEIAVNLFAILLLIVFPNFEEGILYFLRNDPISDHHIGGDIIETEIGMRSQRLVDHHLLRISHQSDRGNRIVSEDFF